MGNTALFVTAALIWGSTWLAITFQLGSVAPEVSVAYRFALASAIPLLWRAMTGASLRFSRRDHGFLAATLFGLNYAGVYSAERYLPSGLVAVLFSTIVFMSPVGTRMAFGAPLGVRALVAAPLGVLGGALLYLPESDATALGVAFRLGATALHAPRVSRALPVARHRHCR